MKIPLSKRTSLDSVRRSRSAFWPLFALLGLLALSAFSCPRGGDKNVPALTIDKVLVDDVLSGEGLKIDKAAVRQAFADSVKKNSGIRQQSGGAYLLHISAMTGRMPPEPGGLPVLVLKAQLKTRAPGRQQFAATIQQRADSPAESADAMLEAAGEALCDRLVSLNVLAHRDVKGLIGALKDKRHWYRLQALNSLAGRKDPQIYQALLPLLNDPDEAVALRAVGVLVGLGDKRAVKDLTDLTHQRSAAFVRQIIYAVAAIGGREAEAYLFTVASGHPDAELRQAAQAAQKLLKKNDPVQGNKAQATATQEPVKNE